MNRSGTTRAVITMLIVALLTGPGGGSASADPATVSPRPGVATFEDGVIDLRSGWGEAEACLTNGATTRCFRSESELDSYLGGRVVGPGAAVFSWLCLNPLRLYSGSNHTGTVLVIANTGVWVDLAALGFNNATSSYRVGSCPALFADGPFGGGSYYPGNTAAGASAAVMLAGWNNRLSSVYVY